VAYDGMYKEGKKSGVGKLTLPNGDKYHGSFAADKFEGEGTYFSANGDIYSGSWKAGVKQGEGQMMYAKDESQLVGAWHKGPMVTGKWIWKDGTSWHGPFKNSQPLGRGVFYFANGMAQEGEYVTEGEAEEGDEAALKTVWKGGAVRAANASAEEVIRAN
jgi:radial spoke head protein 1